MNKSDIVIALEKAVNCFEALSIPYYIGGSVASSAWGMTRATIDVDMVADIKMAHVEHIMKTLEKEYYISTEMIRNAIEQKSSFNLIHLDTMIKIDVFLLKNQPYEVEALSRRSYDTFDEQSSYKFYLSSPEDIILSKLQWYEQGGRISENQWKDVLGVMKVQAGKLDLQYLTTWASKLDLSDLLNRCLNESGLSENPH